MALFLVTARTHDHPVRLVVLASTTTEALAKARTARPLLPRDGFRVVATTTDSVMLLPVRGRPRHREREMAAADWSRISAGAPSYSDIT